MKYTTAAYAVLIAATAVKSELLRGADRNRNLSVDPVVDGQSKDGGLATTDAATEEGEMFNTALSEVNAYLATNPTDTSATNDMCHTIGTYKTAFTTVAEGIKIDTETDQEGMMCAYPTDTDETFPLLSFAHGYGGGGFGIFSYSRMLMDIASSGFVVCAYLNCWTMCPTWWPLHQLDVITTAKDVAHNGNAPRSLIDIPDIEIPDIEIPDIEIPDIEIPDEPDILDELEPVSLPIRTEGDVGVIGHSSGGVSTLMSAMNDTARKYSIGAAVAYDGDGVSQYNNVYRLKIDLGNIDPLLPLFFPASTETDMFGNPPQCKDHAKANARWISEANPDQPLIIACMDDTDHLDNVDNFLHRAPLTVVPYVVAFFGYTLDPVDACIGEYEDILGDQLETISSMYYVNTMF